MTSPPVIGRLPFGTHRRLARVAAAEARRSAPSPGIESTGTPPGMPPGTDPGRWGTELPVDDERRDRLTHAVATAIVGPPRALADVLTDDAVGWCPSFAFTTRAEAYRALSDADDSLAVHRFEALHLWWLEPVTVVQWALSASVDTPLLVDDDVLVEAGGRPLVLGGLSVAELRGARIVSIHTTFDEAALIEQVLLPGVRPEAASGDR